MSNYQPKQGYGNLFRNEKKGDNHPDHRGQLCLPAWIKPGQIIEIAAWEKTGQVVGDFLSIKISEPREKITQAAPSKEVPF